MVVVKINDSKNGTGMNKMNEWKNLPFIGVSVCMCVCDLKRQIDL